MPYDPNRAQKLRRVLAQLRDANQPSARLLLSLCKECSRLVASRQLSKVEQIGRMIRAGAWTEAAFLMMEAELPLWRLRRIVYDDGRWYCAISRQLELPDWLDQAVEADHRDLTLAVLSAFAEALLHNSEVKAFTESTGVSRGEQHNLIDCGNFY